MKLCVIGAGKMGGAFIEAIAKSEKYKILCVEKDEERRKWAEKYSSVYSNHSGVDAEIYLICIKPKDVIPLLSSMKKKEALFISCAAGVSIKSMENAIPQAPIIRCMPNIFCSVKRSASFLSCGKYVNEEGRKKAEELFSLFGKVYFVDEELMNALTALSGCGPAYVLLFAEALMDAGLLIGLSPSMCKEIVCELLYGAAALLEEKNEHPAALRQLVVTPAGITATALYELSRSGFSASVQKAIKTAMEKIEERSI